MSLGGCLESRLDIFALGDVFRNLFISRLRSVSYQFGRFHGFPGMSFGILDRQISACVKRFNTTDTRWIGNLSAYQASIKNQMIKNDEMLSMTARYNMLKYNNIPSRII